MPDTCPECGQRVCRHPGEVALRCENLQCPAQTVRLVRHFAARACLDIEALGGIVAERLAEEGLVASPLDLFSLRVDSLAELNLDASGKTRVFGRKNAEKLLAAVERARTLPLDRWLCALGIPSVGKTTAIQLAAAHDDLRAVAESPLLADILALGRLDEEAHRLNPDSSAQRPKDEKERAERRRALEQVNDRILAIANRLEAAGQIEKREIKTKRNGTRSVTVQTVIKADAAENAVAFFASERGKDLLARLAALRINPRAQAQAQGRALEGKQFVLTGTLASMSRDEAAERIRGQGGTVTSSISGNTSFLVAGANAGARKTSKAAELGVPVLEEDTFLDMLGPDSAVARRPEKQGKAPPEQPELF